MPKQHWHFLSFWQNKRSDKIFVMQSPRCYVMHTTGWNTETIELLKHWQQIWFEVSRCVWELEGINKSIASEKRYWEHRSVAPCSCLSGRTLYDCGIGGASGAPFSVGRGPTSRASPPVPDEPRLVIAPHGLNEQRTAQSIPANKERHRNLKYSHHFAHSSKMDKQSTCIVLSD